jgi:ATP-dependent DNA helicase RecQ
MNHQDNNERALHLLQTVFGYPAFRGQQGRLSAMWPAAAMRWS